MDKFKKLFRELEAATNSANTSCCDFTDLLKRLKFEIKDCGSAGHKVVSHPALALEESTNYNCGHDQGTMVKRPYIKKIFKFVQQHEEAIKEFVNDV